PLRVLKWFARGALVPIIAEHPKMLRGEDLELYLYPADLLIRGKPVKVAKVRALLVTEMLNAPAHLVEDPAGQAIEDELHRLWGAAERPHGPGQIGDGARDRVRAVAQKLARAALPLEQWSL